MSQHEEEVRLDPEEEGGGPVKPFLDHLEDLRWVLIKSLSALVVSMTGCMAGAPYLISVLKLPLQRAQSGEKMVELDWLGPIGGFVSSMKIAFWGGLIIALPFILYFVGQFVLPALKKKEKKYLKLAFGVGAGLFVGGVVLCYVVVLPLSLQGMMAYNKWLKIPSTLWRAEEYFQFIIALMLGMGLSFEIPIVLLTLVRIGILPHDWLVKGRKYFFFINVVVCSFITPDAISTIFLVIPTQILLEICIWISRGWEKQRRQVEAGLSSKATTAGSD